MCEDTEGAPVFNILQHGCATQRYRLEGETDRKDHQSRRC